MDIDGQPRVPHSLSDAFQKCGEQCGSFQKLYTFYSPLSMVGVYRHESLQTMFPRFSGRRQVFPVCVFVIFLQRGHSSPLQKETLRKSILDFQGPWDTALL